ncbi:hypothetical protein CABS01_15922 [Colletotrichum abscissum]|uniref:Uncharacterized protein n=1 Tax=Colletotrichum abscissum TaxID=1671311 RepID=A0A9P9X1K4_9PEZI|nr:uncharacterized protein CABS01_15922 [Colletotrichum abscissum]KAI3531036.1 hypothetical protein CABS02_14305 [Colletotrichum abscissum]KAK1474226.1 hypothetical protein CABS01_15922 [Colletotrichum abscissum]
MVGKGDYNDVFWITAVSLPLPPWPNSVALSKAILLHPGNAKRFDRFAELKTLSDRQGRIHLNLVILFRLLLRCQHLAFDRIRFWDFIRDHWGVSNASSRMVEDLAEIYSDRRRVYLETPKIHKKRHNFLSNLIDAWNSRDPDPPVGAQPTTQELQEEWKYVEESWSELMKHDRMSIIDPDNPPTYGAFPIKKGTPSSFQIRGGSIRSIGKDLASRISVPSGQRQRRDSSTSAHFQMIPSGKSLPSISTTTPDRQRRASFGYDNIRQSSTQGASESAIDDLIQSQGRKRKPSPDAPDSLKRQCLPESPSCSPRLNWQLTPCHEEPSSQVMSSQDHRRTPTHHGAAGSMLDASQDLAEEQHKTYDSDLNDLATIGHQKQSQYDDELLRLLETRVGQNDETMQLLKQQASLVMESEELSRDIRKAHDQLNLLTASKCQDALQKLDMLSSQINSLVAEIMTCRKSSQKIQQRQQDQHGLIESFEGDLKTLSREMKEVKHGLLSNTESSQASETSKKTVRIGSEDRKGVDTQQSIRTETRLAALEERMGARADPTLPRPEGFEDRLERIERAIADQVPNADYMPRILKMEEAIAISTTLINNCRTLVDVSKTSLDQHLGTLNNRIAMVETRLTNHVAEQAEAKKEQAKRMDRIEAELQRQKETTSTQQQPHPGRQPAIESNDFQAQLNALKNSLAVLARGQSMGNADRTSTTPLTPVTPLSQVNQSSLNRLLRPVQNGVPAGPTRPQHNAVSMKDET